MAGTAVARCPWKQPRDPAPWTPAQPATWTMSNTGETVNSETEVGTRGCHMGLGAVGGRDAGALARGLVSLQRGAGPASPAGQCGSAGPPRPHTLCSEKTQSLGTSFQDRAMEGPTAPPASSLFSQCALEGQGRPFLLLSFHPSPAPARGQPSNPWRGAGAADPFFHNLTSAPALCEHLCPGILPSAEHEHTTPAPSPPTCRSFNQQSHIRSYS